MNFMNCWYFTAQDPYFNDRMNNNSLKNKLYSFFKKCSWSYRLQNTHYFRSRCDELNTLKPRQNGRHFAEDTFKCVFLDKNILISINISLKCVPKGPINNIPAQIPIIAWRRPGDKPLSEPMMVSSLTYICVTRAHWIERTNPWAIRTVIWCNVIIFALRYTSFNGLLCAVRSSQVVEIGNNIFQSVPICINSLITKCKNNVSQCKYIWL